jgi:hypothetical protein
MTRDCRVGSRQAALAIYLPVFASRHPQKIAVTCKFKNRLMAPTCGKAEIFKGRNLWTININQKDPMRGAEGGGQMAKADG